MNDEIALAGRTNYAVFANYRLISCTIFFVGLARPDYGPDHIRMRSYGSSSGMMSFYKIHLLIAVVRHFPVPLKRIVYHVCQAYTVQCWQQVALLKRAADQVTEWMLACICGEFAVATLVSCVKCANKCKQTCLRNRGRTHAVHNVQYIVRQLTQEFRLLGDC